VKNLSRAAREIRMLAVERWGKKINGGQEITSRKKKDGGEMGSVGYFLPFFYLF
jgi:hypothetical protein